MTRSIPPLARVLALLLIVALGPPAGGAGMQEAAATDAELAALVARIEAVVRTGDREGYAALASPSADRALVDDFTKANVEAGLTHAVLRERDRGVLKGREGTVYRLILDLFTEKGDRGVISTWRLDVEKAEPDGAAVPLRWRITSQERLSIVQGLFRLRLANRQFDVHNLTIVGEDLSLRVPKGTAFVAEADGQPTAMVLRGAGTMRFSPGPAAERTQLRIFTRGEVLETPFDYAFVRMHPAEFANRVAVGALVPRAVDAREFSRGTDIFREFVGKSFGLDLSDLSRDSWSLTPAIGDMLAEVHTRKYDTLTYARSGSEAEDITVFDRKRKRNIALYSSQRKLASRGRFFSEDDRIDYDVIDYDIDAVFQPDRQWIDGRAAMKIVVKAHAISTFTVRLADELTLRSLTSDRFGRVMFLRVRGQDGVIVNLPTALPRGTTLTLTAVYGGRIAPQGVDREAIAPQETIAVSEVVPEPQFLYSNRSYWYPQSPVTDYATARVRISVPPEYGCVASGDLTGTPRVVAGERPALARRVFEFSAQQPLRYLSFVVSRFIRNPSRLISAASVSGGAPVPAAGGSDGVPPATRATGGETLSLAVEANPRQVVRSDDLAVRTSSILRYFTGLLGDFPYPSFTLALVENQVPGGHSPAYFAVLNQPPPTAALLWRGDPVHFDGFPDFYLAHEIAHQWWGQAVGWKNYHEQWLSEGLAQYFAVLYARENRGADTFGPLIRQMNRTATQYADQGPIYLGYRLGHLQGDSRIFRSILYNKSALVLHMLRGLLGDEAFFKGLRQFYQEFRFTKAGTEDLRRAFEAQAGRSLEGFFEQWVHGAALPSVDFSYRVEAAGAEAQNVVLRFQQVASVFEFPVTVTLTYASGAVSRIVVPVTQQIVEVRVPLQGRLRAVDVNEDRAALGTFRK